MQGSNSLPLPWKRNLIFWGKNTNRGRGEERERAEKQKQKDHAFLLPLGRSWRAEVS
jgi:hypothetical protein